MARETRAWYLAKTLSGQGLAEILSTVVSGLNPDGSEFSIPTDIVIGDSIAVTYAAPSNATSSADEASRVVKASAGTLWGLTGHSSRTSSQYIQLHNAAALPSDTAVPVIVFIVPASSNFSLDFGVYGRAFATGIVICNSSTRATKTIGSADCWFDVQYT